MRTRRASCPSSPPPPPPLPSSALPSMPSPDSAHLSKRPRRSYKHAVSPLTGFHSLHDDLLLSLMISIARTATRPADLLNVMLTSKKFLAMGMNPLVLANANASALGVKAVKWSEGSHRFMKRCADAGNVEAWYTLGMIRFYCLGNKVGGASLMTKAAMSSHAAALHSLAVIQFNGSGGSRSDKDLKAGVALCARAASLGHVDSMRELGHCLQDGYGVVRNLKDGRRLLLEANAREAAAAVASSPKALKEMAMHLKRSARLCIHHLCLHPHLHYSSFLGKYEAMQKQPNIVETVCKLLQKGGCSLLSDFGCNVAPAQIHIANRFLIDWFGMHPLGGLRLCSHANCGRPESRRHEFRRCSVCGKVNYCSRTCQAMDWKMRHKYQCLAMVGWEGGDDDVHEDEIHDDEDEDNAITEENDDEVQDMQHNK